MKKVNIKAAYLAVGDELLIGQTLNTNAAYLGRWLNRIGVDLIESRTVMDREYEMVEAMKQMLNKVDWLFVTGGLGPTKDDITKKAIAKTFQRPLVYDPNVVRHVEEFLLRIGKIPTLKDTSDLFLIPQGSKVFYNDQGTAPAILVEKEDKLLLAFPGVPREFHHLLGDKVGHELKKRYTFCPPLQTTILTVGLGEPMVERAIESIRSKLPQEVALAFLPHYGMVKIRLTIPPKKAKDDHQRLESAVSAIEDVLRPHVFGRDEDTLSRSVGHLLMDSGGFLGTAESCTGGFLAHKITSVPGSSAYFKGSIVSYANEVKQNVLGVPSSMLQKWGAVSEPVARKMAEGAINSLGVQLAISTTGVAGPGGGTLEKPIGTVWVAVSNGTRTHAQKFVFPYDRLGNIEATSIQALDMARRFLSE